MDGKFYIAGSGSTFYTLTPYAPEDLVEVGGFWRCREGRRRPGAWCMHMMSIDLVASVLTEEQIDLCDTVPQPVPDGAVLGDAPIYRARGTNYAAYECHSLHWWERMDVKQQCDSGDPRYYREMRKEMPTVVRTASGWCVSPYAPSDFRRVDSHAGTVWELGGVARRRVPGASGDNGRGGRVRRPA